MKKTRKNKNGGINLFVNDVWTIKRQKDVIAPNITIHCSDGNSDLDEIFILKNTLQNWKLIHKVNKTNGRKVVVEKFGGFIDWLESDYFIARKELLENI